MMTISKLEQQKRHPDRVNVYLDGEFALGLHKDVVRKFSLRKGDSVSDKLMEQLANEEEFSAAKNKALRFLSRRMRSEHEIRFKLKDYEFSPKVIDSVVQYLTELNFINDTNFAKALVRDLQKTKSAGKRLLRQKLLQKGISKIIIDSVLSEGNVEEEELLALNAAKKYLKKYQSSRKKTEKDIQVRRLTQTLQRKGFSWYIISKAINQSFNQKIIEEDI
ncbi:MAG: RecX family transcriptional regulator [Ignavibacteriales bacterium]|nr:RecX family transcriptional regulator [Ignavibacteriales bacterium]